MNCWKRSCPTIPFSDLVVIYFKPLTTALIIVWPVLTIQTYSNTCQIYTTSMFPPCVQEPGCECCERRRRSRSRRRRRRRRRRRWQRGWAGPGGLWDIASPMSCAMRGEASLQRGWTAERLHSGSIYLLTAGRPRLRGNPVHQWYGALHPQSAHSAPL